VPGSAGAIVNAGGQIVATGNYGTANDVSIDIGDLRSDQTGTIALGFSKTQTADGESAFTQFVVFDSLGIAISVRLTAVLESVASPNTIYRFYAESPGDSDPSIALGSGTITFDSQGKVSAVAGNALSIDRDNVASLSPLQFSLDLTGLGGLATGSSTLRATLQNSSAPGSLNGFLIEESGLIQGVFDNGLTRVLGQVVLARFPNAPGLIHQGDNLFQEGPNSGLPTVGAPGANGNGTLLSGALELSNADVGRNLVDLIVASTNYRGNARVIDAVQELLDNLLLLGR
jgi:flagellar hook protein FlgE